MGLGETIRHQLKTIRRSKNLTQQWVADQLDIVRATIIKWENKGAGSATVDQIELLAKCLAIPTEELLGLKQKSGLIIDQLNPVAEQLNKLRADLRSLEFQKSEKRIERDMEISRAEDLLTEEGRKQFAGEELSKWTPSQFKALITEIRADADHLDQEIQDIELRQKVIPKEIKRLEAQLRQESHQGEPHKKKASGL